MPIVQTVCRYSRLLLPCVLFIALVSSALAQDCSAWILRDDRTDMRRAWPAMTFDAVRGRMVMFGGLGMPAPPNWTWEWNGQSWLGLMPSSPPAARHSHATVYDPVRQRVMLFGGGSAMGPILGDTWEWNGVQWTQRALAGPNPRLGHAMVYDATRARIVLFGGASGSAPNATYYDDIWEYDSVSWTRRTPSEGPPGRAYHALVATSNGMILFGGANATQRFGDTWRLSGSWESVSESGPAARDSHAMTFDSSRNRVVLFGGTGGWVPATRLNDTWEFDGLHWTQIPAPGPAAREGAVMAFDSQRSAVILFGGAIIGGYLGETWKYPGLIAPGDCNCSGRIDNFDIDAFVAGLMNDQGGFEALGGTPECWGRRLCWGDFDGDGAITNFDVDGFVDVLSGGV